MREHINRAKQVVIQLAQRKNVDPRGRIYPRSENVTCLTRYALREGLVNLDE
jgi:hypothetical protein